MGNEETKERSHCAAGASNRKKFHDYKEVMAAATGMWPSILGRLGVDQSYLSGKHSPCPGCGGKDRFRFDDQDGRGTWLCSGGGDFQSGDGVALVAHVRQCEWKDAVNLVGDDLGLSGKEWHGKGTTNGVAAPPRAPKEKRINEMFDLEALREQTDGVEDVDEEWFMARSPVDPRRVMPGEFLNAIFEPGERALVFTNFYSQGDFAWEVGGGGFRLGDAPEIRAVRSALPINGGKDGVWYLSNPVSLRWQPNPRKDGQKSRRTKECVTAWRYLVLESDVSKDLRQKGRIQEALEVEQRWMKFLAAFPDPIRAIYSSGGGSWHALVCVYADTWAGMDGLLKGNPHGRTRGARMGAKALWAKYGADPGALTPVRLTRLPGCTRGGRDQRLIYLNPNPRGHFEECGRWVKRRIVDLVPTRAI